MAFLPYWDLFENQGQNNVTFSLTKIIKVIKGSEIMVTLNFSVSDMTTSFDPFPDRLSHFVFLLTNK